MALELSLSVCDYDRTVALFDGRAPIEGCDVTAVVNSPEESFHRAFKYQEFDVTEISMSSYLVTLSRNDAHYVAIPAFVSRLFRHSSIYVRTDRIKTPADLKGKTMGIPEYQMTANVWVRGMLEEEYGVRPSDIKWRRGGLEEPGREERATINLPPEIDLKQVPDGRTISDMLAKGEIDGLLSARAPSCFLQGAPNIGRLFPDYPTVEEAYYRKTKLFPVMHAIAIRRSLVENDPWVAVNVYKAFIKAKALCMHELGQIGHLHATLPWPVHAYDRARQIMGEDYWPYGAHENQLPLETLARYSFQQGLSVRQVPLEEMFAKPTYELTKI
ncbi:MAG: ABC transporter substrate-binding protein [Alphaproteobacteria bacterium]|nr:ABC transporter substrate-binding protein [Alphaproteobacteria bacterium]